MTKTQTKQKKKVSHFAPGWLTKKLHVVIIAQIRYTFNVHTGIRLDVRLV